MNTDTLELAPLQPGEQPMKTLAPFQTLEQQARKMIADAEAIALLPPTPANAKVARTMRLEIKPLRVSVEKRHAELKRPILDAGTALDDGKNALLSLLKPMEEKLLAIEQHAEREKARVEAELQNARFNELVTVFPQAGTLPLGTMQETEYQSLLTDMRASHEAKLEREAAERAAVEAAAQADRERIEAQRLENERLKKEASEREEAQKAEREETAARINAERDRAEEAERALITAQAKIVAEAAAKKAAEAKAACAPDKKKLVKLAADILAMTMIELRDQAMQGLVATQGEKFAAWIEKEAGKL